MRWHTICFDLDNTLFSHEEAFKKAIYFCFDSLVKRKNLHKEINLNELFFIFKKNSDLFWNDYEKGVISPTEYRRRRFLTTATQFELPLNENDADEFHEHYYNIVDNFSVPYPHLHTLISTLVEANIKIGIITNGTVDTQYNKIKKLKLDQWISNDYIFVSAEVKVAKPEREIFDLAKEKLRSKGDYLFVGDSWEHDVVGAIEAGWDSIFLNTRNEDQKTAHKPVKICSSLEEVANVIYKENHLKG